MEVFVVHVPWETHKDQLRRVRERVFIDEQGVPRELEWDGKDEDACHFLALNEAGQALGCARLLPGGQIGRMAVLADHRKRGIGARLLDAVLDEAKRRGITRVVLHAQAGAVDFYRRAGFIPRGEEFMEAGIPHLEMELALPIPFEPSGQTRPPLIREQEPVDHAPAELKQFHGESACRAVLLECLQLARRNLCIYSQHLDHTLFDSAAVANTLSAFVRRGAPANLRILIHSSQLIVSRGHRLLELARRLDSKIEIRRVVDDLATDVHSCAVWDTTGYWLIPDHREYEGFANGYDPVHAAKLCERFDYLWNKSLPDPELRALRL